MFAVTEHISIIRRSLLYFALFVRLVKKTVRARREVRRLKTRLAAAESELARRIQAKDAEIYRLEEIIEWQNRRFEIEILESRDRLLELFGTVGTRFSQTEPEEKIAELKFRPFKLSEKNAGPLDSLSASERILYEEMRENHFAMGREAGFSDAEIERFWKDHEHEEIEHIKREVVA